MRFESQQARLLTTYSIVASSCRDNYQNEQILAVMAELDVASAVRGQAMVPVNKNT